MGYLYKNLYYLQLYDNTNDDLKHKLNEMYDHINTFLSVVSQYHEFKIKLLCTEPKIDDKISIFYRVIEIKLQKVVIKIGRYIHTKTIFIVKLVIIP